MLINAWAAGQQAFGPSKGSKGSQAGLAANASLHKLVQVRENSNNILAQGFWKH
jgi:hypothetical protein